MWTIQHVLMSTATSPLVVYRWALKSRHLDLRYDWVHQMLSPNNYFRMNLHWSIGDGDDLRTDSNVNVYLKVSRLETAFSDIQMICNFDSNFISCIQDTSKVLQIKERSYTNVQQSFSIFTSTDYINIVDMCQWYVLRTYVYRLWTDCEISAANMLCELIHW